MPRIPMRRKGHSRKDSGFMLLLLMLAVALITITLLGAARNYRRSIVRDREVEMIHRGEQYERAIRKFYRKNGRYPTSLEELENTNKVRYLRKRYKDPMTKDGVWKLAHLTDLAFKNAGGLATAASAKGTAADNPFQANSGDLSSAATAAAAAEEAAAAAAAANSSQGTGNSTSGGTSSSTTSSSSTNPISSGQVLGGGGILGVVSKSKAEGIHSFGDKTRYNEWFFIYDPAQDRGQLPRGPYNPNAYLPGSANGPNPSGSPTTTPPNTGAPGVQIPTPQSPNPPGIITPGSTTQ